MSVVDEIKATVRISELAAGYGEVKRRGRPHVCRCLCGENSDRNPSFMLDDDDFRNLYRNGGRARRGPNANATTDGCH